ncbi:LCP family protein [Corynebacterium sp. CCUG 71335]|uniref:LCP family protein n=1 Tax=Corynebacterium sp. CCUG 71335 TaxID=2823892 RepID=UPI00210ED425|nr:LCP family protein [Corynebacterium sp. CCUG 71335]MCQ4618967.1 LCP family protein [Corynebacterium pseudogenitalium]MCQ4621448.1 LCP family protein [Corynebacterium sp. CCUG 71335]
MSTTPPRPPHSNDPRDNPGDFVVGRDGKPLIDRYGRPIRKRATSQNPSSQPNQTQWGVGRGDEEPVRRAARERQPASPERPDRAERPRQSERPVRTAQPAQSDRPRQYLPNETGYQPRQTPHHSPQSAERAADRPNRPARNAQRYRDDLPGDLNQPRQRPGQRPTQRRDQPYEPPRQHRRPRMRMPRLRGCIPTALTLLLVLIVAGTLFVDTRLTRVDAFPDNQVANTAGTNWLIVGSDSRQGLSDEDIERLGTGGDIGQGRTDTIMLMHLPATGKPTLVSLPRDSYVEIPGYGMDKINSAFAFGGPKLLTETVEQATGLRIDHYAEIGMGGLAGLTDAVGGVELCPSEPIQDPLANLDVQAGCQKMDGPTSLGYVRTRATAMGDLDRVQRQREFMSALMKRVVSPGVLLNPFRLVPMALRGTDLLIVGEGDHVWHLARMALGLRSGVETETVPIGQFADSEVGSVLIWDEVGAQELFAKLR